MVQEHESIPTIDLLELRADRIEEAVEVFRQGGWNEESLLYVKAEIMAYIKGDIDGYIRARFIVAAVNKQIVGVAAWAPSMCSFAIYELSWATVLPQWRHRGINTKMLEERLKQIKIHHGPTPFQVIVCTWDNPMYAKAGFVSTYRNELEGEDNTRKNVLVARL